MSVTVKPLGPDSESPDSTGPLCVPCGHASVALFLGWENSLNHKYCIEEERLSCNLKDATLKAKLQTVDSVECSMWWRKPSLLRSPGNKVTVHHGEPPPPAVAAYLHQQLSSRNFETEELGNTGASGRNTAYLCSSSLRLLRKIADSLMLAQVVTASSSYIYDTHARAQLSEELLFHRKLIYLFHQPYPYPTPVQIAKSSAVQAFQNTKSI